MKAYRALRATAILLGVFATTLSIPTAGYASFVASGGVLTDTVTNLMWYQDLSDLTNKNSAEQLQFMSGLNAGTFGGTDTWRIATWLDLQTMLPTLYTDSSLFIPSSQGANQTTWYAGRANLSNGPWGGSYNAYEWTPYLPDYTSGYESIYTVSSSTASAELGMWIVSGGSNGPGPGSVPEPASVLLVVSGFMGLAGIRMRQKTAK